MQAVGWSSAAKGDAPCSREETWTGRDTRDRVNGARAGRLRALRPNRVAFWKRPSCGHRKTVSGCRSVGMNRARS